MPSTKHTRPSESTDLKRNDKLPVLAELATSIAKGKLSAPNQACTASMHATEWEDLAPNEPHEPGPSEQYPGSRPSDRQQRSSSRPYARRRQSAPGDDNRPQRAPQACSRCRRMKLRCVGGLPCFRCKRANNLCDYGAKPHDEGDNALDPTARLAQLERAVYNLVNNLSAIIPASRQEPNLQAQLNLPLGDGFGQAMSQGVLAPAHSSTSQITFHDAQLSQAPPHLSFDETLPSTFGQSPFTSSTVPSASPADQSNMNWSVRFDSSIPDKPPTKTKQDLAARTTPEGRLKVAQEGEMGLAPFQPLLIRPGVWENKEQSRRSSPQPGETSRDDSWSIFEARAGPCDDPISNGIVSSEVAEAMLDLYFEKSHHFIPIVHLSQPHLQAHVELRQRSAFLYTSLLAIAGRFYARHRERNPTSGLPYMEDTAPAEIRKLAFSHLAATLMRKEHTLSDVQATMILALWGLLQNGKGPDPWLLTGHCQRMAQRLGIHKAATLPIILRAASWEGGPVTSQEDIEALDKALTQWKTSLYCYHYDGYLSLGFGRPLSMQQEPLNEHLYLQALQMRMNTAELAGDVYIASLAQLTKIGRDLISWAHVLTDWQAGGFQTPLVQDGRDYSICTMLRDLNRRLDEWTNTWAWNGSLYAIQLGPSSRFAKLQSDHVRLCLNSIALKSDLQESATGEDAILIQQCIKRAAEASINLIQTHQDAARSDHVYSYSFEYIFNSLAQAAVFILRLYLARHPIPVERPVLVHYIRTAIEVIEETDFSVTRHQTVVAKICRDLCKVAGITLPPRSGGSDESDSSPGDKLMGENVGEFDIDSMLQLEGAEFDLGFLLGLPSEAMGPVPTEP